LTTDGSLAGYSRDICRTLAALIRSARDPATPFKLPMTEAASACALELYRKLDSGSATWKCLHPAFKTVWELPNSVIDNGEQDTYLLHFLAAAAVKEDGTLMDASRLVTWITHLKYGSRAFSMIEGEENVENYGGILE
jgi:hypothetical protein